MLPSQTLAFATKEEAWISLKRYNFCFLNSVISFLFQSPFCFSVRFLLPNQSSFFPFPFLRSVLLIRSKNHWKNLLFMSILTLGCGLRSVMFQKLFPPLNKFFFSDFLCMFFHLLSRNRHRVQFHVMGIFSHCVSPPFCRFRV